ncbi:MAG: hypothetical protein AB8H79_04635 [Myxococcota bacterium]
MTTTPFQRALTATARIACFASFAGCGAAQVGATIPDTPVSAGGADVYEPDVPAYDDEEPVDECLDIVQGIEVGDWDKSTASRKEKACCTEFMDEIGPDGWDPPEGADWQDISACCWALQDMGQTYAACTPWGPPAPPTMLRPVAVA